MSYETILEGLCRVCLCHSVATAMTPLVSPAGRLTDHGIAVKTFANIEIKNEESLPIQICQRCLELLKHAIIFKKTCEETDRDLRQVAPDKTAVVHYAMARHYLPRDWCAGGAGDGGGAGDEGGAGGSGSDCEDDYIRTEDCLVGIDEPDFLENLECRVRPRRRCGQQTEPPYNEDNECDVCKKKFVSKESWTNHMARHYGAGFVCEYCGKLFKSNAEYRIHTMSKHGVQRRYSCPDCDFKGTTRRQMRVHAARRHTGERNFACDRCDKSFYSWQVLKGHLVTHGEKQFQCDQCPRKFFRRGDINKHAQTFHGGRKVQYRCTVCQTLYIKNSTCRKHMVKVHGIPREQQGRLERVVS